MSQFKPAPGAVLGAQSASAHLELAAALRAQRRTTEAIEHYKQAIRLQPQSATAFFQLGEACMSLGRADDAEGAYRACTTLDAKHAVAQQRLGWLRYKRRDFLAAVACYEASLAIDDSNSAVHLDRGMALMELDRLEEAKTSITRAIRLQPQNPELFFQLTRCLKRSNQLDEATTCLEQAVQASGGAASVRLKAGSAIRLLGRGEAARRVLSTIASQAPEYPNAQTILGTIALGSGQPTDALAHYKNALDKSPVFFPARTGLLLALNYAAGYSAQEIFQEHVKFETLHARGLSKTWPHRPGPRTDRRLRVGYVSGDFRAHSVAYFAETVLACHDHTVFELYAYSNCAVQDDVTQRLKGYFDHWRDIRPLSDEQAAQCIRQDAIDILVDLSGHTADNRLMVFARKPAPVQVTWLGYPNTTGLRAMDYRLTDAHAEPVGMTERYNVERLWRLPDVFCCYTPCANRPERRSNSALLVQASPSIRKGFITFGSFNNLSKISLPVVALWARLLQELPDAKLMLEAPGLDTEVLYRQVEAWFTVHGIGSDRLVLLGRKPEQQYVLYHEVDIALDPFPCNGGTTSFDTLWMGVPLVTLAGQTFVSRMGASLLSNVGLPELIAQTEDQYIAIAKSLAADVQELNRLRQGLRARMERSALLDKPRFTHAMEEAFLEMWRVYAEGSTPLGS